MVIRSNAPAFQALRQWNLHNSRIAKAIERLSTGSRINRAADDPAGLSMMEKMKLQLTLLKTDQVNVSNTMSMLEVQDGVMSGTQSMLNRMLELSEQAMTGTLSETERKNLDSEYQQLLDEIQRTGVGSTFNSKSLFQNTKTKQAGAAQETGELAEPLEAISFEGGNLEAYLDGLDHLLLDISTAAKAGDNDQLLSLGIDRSNGRSDQENLRSAVIDFTRENAANLLNTATDGEHGGSDNRFVITITGGDIVVDMPKMDKENLGLKDTNLLSSESASEAMEAVKSAIDSVSGSRGSIGALYNRLEHTMNNLSNMEENLTDALSRISDTDMAKEMMTLVKEQMLAQASMFAMAQANQRPAQVLELLKSL